LSSEIIMIYDDQRYKIVFHNTTQNLQSINQSMAVTDAGTKVSLCPYHTFYTL